MFWVDVDILPPLFKLFVGSDSIRLGLYKRVLINRHPRISRHLYK